MEDILRNPELRNSRITEEFLTFEDHKRMKRKFEEYMIMEKPKALEDLVLLSGNVEISLTPATKNYNEKMKTLISKFETNL